MMSIGGTKPVVRVWCASLVVALTAVAVPAGQASLPRRIAGGTFEASGAVYVPGSEGVLFVDDASTREVLWMELSSDGVQKQPASRVALPGADVVDFEGMTTDGTHFYAVGSQSKHTGFDGDGLVRFTFDPVTRRAGRVETVRALKRFLSRHVAELQGIERRVGDEVLNIEAIAWDPVRSRLLLGLRAPVAGSHALVVPLTLRDPHAPYSADNLMVEGGRAMRIPTGGAGLRSLEYDPVRKRFLVITGAPHDAETKDFRVYEWDGTEGAPLREVRTYSRKLKPEGITRARLAGRDALVVVFDTSAYEVLR